MLNLIHVIGNVGTDPEMRYTPTGKAVTSFRLATSRKFNDTEGERKEETDWFTVVCWNKLAETVNEHLAKSQRAYIEGRVHLHEYESSDGKGHARIEITANRVLFLDRSEKREAQPSHDDYTPSDDLPF